MATRQPYGQQTPSRRLLRSSNTHFARFSPWRAPAVPVEATAVQARWNSPHSASPNEGYEAQDLVVVSSQLATKPKFVSTGSRSGPQLILNPSPSLQAAVLQHIQLWSYFYD
jgi:hypothetical protein